jgi:hypothetical protein
VAIVEDHPLLKIPIGSNYLVDDGCFIWLVVEVPHDLLGVGML